MRSWSFGGIAAPSSGRVGPRCSSAKMARRNAPAPEGFGTSRSSGRSRASSRPGKKSVSRTVSRVAGIEGPGVKTAGAAGAAAPFDYRRLRPRQHHECAHGGGEYEKHDCRRAAGHRDRVVVGGGVGRAVGGGLGSGAFKAPGRRLAKKRATARAIASATLC